MKEKSDAAPYRRPPPQPKRPGPPGQPGPSRRPRRALPVNRLDQHLGYWLRYVAHQVSQDLSRKTEDIGVTLAESIVLCELYDGDRRQGALAEKLGLTRGTISKLAARLVTNHMITQEAGLDGDSRSRMLALTEIGRVAVPVLAAAADETEREFFGGLDLDTRRLLLRALREIARRRGVRAAPAGWW